MTKLSQKWKMNDYERELFNRELNSFLPDKIFDAHVHLYDKSLILGDALAPVNIGDGLVDIMTIPKYKKYIKEITPEREVSGLFMGMPKNGDNIQYNLKNYVDNFEDIQNNFVSEQIKTDHNCRGIMLITPSMDPEFIRQEVRKLKLSGLKCYRSYSPKTPNNYFADISSYLPEEQVKIAHEEGLSITLHMIKERGLADKKNNETIRRYCKKYPNIKMILAHGGMGFNPYNLYEGAYNIKDFDNIWFDTSAVTEASAFEIIINFFGHTRLLYASDSPICFMRFINFSIGDLFQSIPEDKIEEVNNLSHLPYSFKMVMVGLQSIRSIKLSSINLKLSDNQIEDIFYNNSGQIFNLVH